MRLAAIPCLLVLIAGCSSPEQTTAEIPDESGPGPYGSEPPQAYPASRNGFDEIDGYASDAAIEIELQVAETSAIMSDPAWEQSAMAAAMFRNQDISADEFADFLYNSGLHAEVTFDSTAGEGAFIVYRLISRASEFRTGRSTLTTESVPFGIYEVWAERGGQPTSQRQFLYIVRPQLHIEIEEITSGDD